MDDPGLLDFIESMLEWSRSQDGVWVISFWDRTVMILRPSA